MIADPPRSSPKVCLGRTFGTSAVEPRPSFSLTIIAEVAIAELKVSESQGAGVPSMKPFSISLQIVVSVLICHFNFEDTGCVVDFYRLGGATIKPIIRGREAEGVQMPLKVTPL